MRFLSVESELRSRHEDSAERAPRARILTLAEDRGLNVDSRIKSRTRRICSRNNARVLLARMCKLFYQRQTQLIHRDRANVCPRCAGLRPCARVHACMQVQMHVPLLLRRRTRTHICKYTYRIPTHIQGVPELCGESSRRRRTSWKWMNSCDLSITMMEKNNWCYYKYSYFRQQYLLVACCFNKK